MAGAKRAICALLLACVGPTTAFTRAPTPLHGRAPTALRASPEEDAAVACCKVKSPADEATVRANFRALAAKSADARFDGDAAQAGDLVGKNPGLLFQFSDDVEIASGKMVLEVLHMN